MYLNYNKGQKTGHSYFSRAHSSMACPRQAFITAVVQSLHGGFSMQELNLETTEQILHAVNRSYRKGLKKYVNLSTHSQFYEKDNN